MKKKSAGQAKKISNRRARHDYALDDSLMVGLELTGKEVKSLRMGHGSLQGAYVNVNNNEIWLINALISGGPGMAIDPSDQRRSRRLLARRKEIDSLIAAKQQGRTIVPLELLTKGRYIKLRIAAGKGKKNYDKRQTLKERDDKRAVARLRTTI